jgi:hypothetical protein
MYVTLSLDGARQVDPATIKDTCIRIQLKPDETYDLEIDCLQLSLQRLSGEEEPTSVTSTWRRSSPKPSISPAYRPI